METVRSNDAVAMSEHQLDSTGNCSTCKEEAVEKDIVDCMDCRMKFHTDCNGTRPFCTNRAFLDAHVRMRSQTTNHFPFICSPCITRRELNKASHVEEQLAAVMASVAALTKEVQSLKQLQQTAVNAEHVDNTNSNNNSNSRNNSKKDNISNNNVNNNNVNNNNGSNNECNESISNNDPGVSTWKDSARTQAMKSKLKKVTVCIKSNGREKVDSKKVENIITANGIQVVKASVNKTGDMYVDLPTDENRDKLIPLLSEEVLPGSKVINLKEKLPTISIRGVSEFTNEEEFIMKLKQQNEKIRERIDEGSELSVVFKKEFKKREAESDDDVEYHVVVRVAEDIRDVIKSMGDRIFLGVRSHRVVDRFYVKSCYHCHKFGHYHGECTSNRSCGYCCSSDHESKDCPVYASKDQSKYKCTNCEEAGKEHSGHSSHWQKCPTYLELQKKLMKSIPYYSKNEK